MNRRNIVQVTDFTVTIAARMEYLKRNGNYDLTILSTKKQNVPQPFFYISSNGALPAKAISKDRSLVKLTMRVTPSDIRAILRASRAVPFVMRADLREVRAG